MNASIIDRINNDLKDSQINWIVAILFIPIAFTTYLSHEFGHWIVGEILGNSMTLSLNNSDPKTGFFLKDSDALWSAMGGPAFTIIIALTFLFITQKTKSIYAYSVVFFTAFSRFYPNVFGGISLQDESRIAKMLYTNEYVVVMIVLLILFLIVWKCNRIMNLNLKAVGYFTTLGTLAILLVIGVNELI